VPNVLAVLVIKTILPCFHRGILSYLGDISYIDQNSFCFSLFHLSFTTLAAPILTSAASSSFR